MQNNTYQVGDKVIYDRFAGSVREVCTGQLQGMYVVRLERGEICTGGSTLKSAEPEWIDRADVLSQNALADSKPVESNAVVQEYSLKSGNGAKHVRWATRVTFPNGRRLEFTEPMSRKYAILQAQNALYIAYRDNWRLTMTDDQKPMSRAHYVATLEKAQ